MSSDAPSKAGSAKSSQAKSARPALGGIGVTDDTDLIRQYGLSKGFIPTEAGEIAAPAPAAPQPASTPAPEPRPMVIRPAPTQPWQAMLPNYLVDELRQAAAREGTAQKVIVLRALRQAGFRVDDIDLQDLRRR
ncbi:hypothetical protein EI613_32110 (plasmid) [Azospirillum sp. 412522]|nr:hypothetical protein [Azospirillum sp. 412522]MBY6266497.1 hypothetical protein [Azospirillum sp. 412522]